MLALGDAHEVDMVGHQAVRENLKAVLFAIPRKQVEIETAVGIVQKNLLLPVTALSHVMRKTRGHDSGYSRHGRIIPEYSARVKEAMSLLL